MSKRPRHIGRDLSQPAGRDNGAGAVLGDFKSRIAGIGPQIGYFFPVGKRKSYVNVKGYHEFNARNRPEGWNAWVTARNSAGLVKIVK